MKIDKIVYLYVLIVFLGWGLSVFFDKMVTNRMGNKAILPLVVSLAVSLVALLFFYFFSKTLGYDSKGIGLMLIGFLLNSVGIIAYFLLFLKTDLTWAVPVTALYPVIPIILGIVILHESLTWTKITGVVLSLAAIIFLSL